MINKIVSWEMKGKPALIFVHMQHGVASEDGVLAFFGHAKAARKAGVRTVAIHTRVADKMLLAEQRPDYILPDLKLLFSCLGDLQEAKEA